MSLRCKEGNDCPYEIKFECSRDNRVHMCNQHRRAHTSVCHCSPQDIENYYLVSQADEVSKAISHLKELRAKVWANSDNLIQIIQKASRILMSCLETQQKNLDEIQFGTAWDTRKIESIKVLEIEDISLANFESAIEGIVSFKEALPNKIIKDPPVRPPVVPRTLEQKKQQALGIGVSFYIDEYTQEVHFTEDGKYVFICNLYVDCKFYQGIRYAGCRNYADGRSYAECRSYAGSRSYAASRSYAVGRSYAGRMSYADGKYY